MKAIIIAAGPGSRMRQLTSNKPKCMLEFNGKTLLQHQVTALKDSGIERIAVIKGYKAEMLNYPELTYYINNNYMKNNILSSLFYAEAEMDDEFISVYSDIFYSKDIVKKLINSKGDISIVVDIDWRWHYQGRVGHPIEEAECVIFDNNNRLLKIGKILPDKNQAKGEFIGMIKCSRKGAKIFKNHFNRLKNSYGGRPFQKAPTFEQAYLTDMLQDLADADIAVDCVLIKGGWKEIDTVWDYESLVEGFSKASSK